MLSVDFRFAWRMHRGRARIDVDAVGPERQGFNSRPEGPR
jgi:hypothetical protein